MDLSPVELSAERIGDDLVVRDLASGDPLANAVTVEGQFTTGQVEVVLFADPAFANSIYTVAGGVTGGDAFIVLGDGADVFVGSGARELVYGNGGADNLAGGGGGDMLSGGAGNDTLSGGAGDDVLAGGTGADTFVFLSVLDGTDTVADFGLAEGDQIDLSAVLGGADLSGGLDGFVELAEQNGDTVLRVDADGGGDGFLDLAILADVTGLGSADDLNNAGGFIV